MNLGKILFEIRNGQRRFKPKMKMMISLAAFVIFVLVIFMFAYQNNAEGKRESVGPFIVRPAAPTKEPDYNIIKVDTIPLGKYFNKTEAPQLRCPIKLSPQNRLHK